MTCSILSSDTRRQYNNKIYVECEQVNETTLLNLRDDLQARSVYNKLNKDFQANPNTNYQILANMLADSKNKHIPKKVRKFNRRKDKKEKWMTYELLNEVNRKNDMYVDWKKHSPSPEIYNDKKTNFKTFERIVDENIEKAQKNYYHNVFHTFRTNMKKTWTIINDTLGRNKKKFNLA